MNTTGEALKQIRIGDTIKDLVEEAHRNAKEKGWYDSPVSLDTSLANIHGEVSEAWEEYRAGKKPNEVYYIQKDGHLKPCGIPSELADIVIRVFDTAAYHDIDLEAAIIEKMRFNRTRDHRHGGKVC